MAKERRFKAHCSECHRDYEWSETSLSVRTTEDDERYMSRECPEGHEIETRHLS